MDCNNFFSCFLRKRSDRKTENQTQINYFFHTRTCLRNQLDEIMYDKSTYVTAKACPNAAKNWIIFTEQPIETPHINCHTNRYWVVGNKQKSENY